MISANYSDDDIFGLYGHYYIDATYQPILSPKDLVDVSKITLVPLAPKLLIAPKISNELYRMFDDHVMKSLHEIEKTYMLISPAYVKDMRNYTHILDKIVATDYNNGNYEYDGPTVRFNGAPVYAQANTEFYEARPLAVTLERGERHDWDQRVRANYFEDISRYLKNEPGSPNLIYIEKLIAESDIDIKALSESDGLYVSHDLTCVIPRSVM